MDPRRTMAEVGEFALIDALRSRIPLGTDVLLGPGDDAAVLSMPHGHVVACADMLVESVHFRRDWSGPVDIGVKAAAQNLADVAAMGARPTGLLLSLAVPASTPVGWMLDLVDGVVMEARRAGASLIGGDLASSDAAVVAVTALGTLEGRPPVTRAGAHVGDVVALAGVTGIADAGLAVLTRGFGSPRAAVSAHRRPVPDYDAAMRAATHATAMIDTSDGLLADASHIARASGVTLAIHRDCLVIADVVAQVASALGADPWPWVLAGGEDHAFLATFSSAAEVPQGFHVIGEVLAPGDAPVLVDGMTLDIRAGHEHFR